MREIKFRLRDKEKKVMIPNTEDDYEEEYCYLVMFIGGSLALCWSQDDDVFFKDVSDKYEIMQFTGLKDSKGKEIYEGDIVSWKAEGAIGEWLVGIVKWEEDRFIVERVNSPLWVYEGITCRSYAIKGEFYAEYRIPSFEWDELEIIGNIYENPELLKEVENG